MHGTASNSAMTQSTAHVVFGEWMEPIIPVRIAMPNRILWLDLYP